MSIFNEIKDSFRHGTALTKLIYVNIGLFLLLHASIAIFYLANSENLVDNLLSWMALPADIHKLFSRPWTLFTYMFLHKDFFHLLFNIAWLYWFGKIFLIYFSEKKLLNIYLLGGLTGALFFILSFNIFPVLKLQVAGSIALGASAAVMAMVIAISAYVPTYTIQILFIGPVKIIWIALISFILSSIVDFSLNTGGKIAHIGGALFGYLYTLNFKRGTDITDWFSKTMDSIFSLFKKRKKMNVIYKRPVNDLDYNSHKMEEQKEIDRILDKISSSGYASLSPQEKELLFKMGEKKID